jgi:hypothetical protein
VDVTERTLQRESIIEKEKKELEVKEKGHQVEVQRVCHLTSLIEGVRWMMR